MRPDWYFPPSFLIRKEEITEVSDERGPLLGSVVLGARRLEDLAAALRTARRDVLARVPVEEIVGAVDRVARRLMDRGERLRSSVLEGIEDQSGSSPAMAESILDGMARDWTGDRIRLLLRSEFPDPEVLDGFREGVAGARTRASGYPLTFHLGAGTVPGVATTSMIRALLVKSSVFLKPGRGDVALPVAFAQALSEEDPGLGSAVAVAYWSRLDSEPTRAALEAADLVVVYGGDETVAWMRARLDPRKPMLAYRHRVGVALVGREALGSTARRTAAEAARATGLFDQRGCVSPQVCFVEEGGEIAPRQWIEMLAAAFRDLEAVIPSGDVSLEEAVAVQQVRGAAELEEAAGKGSILHGGLHGSWTILFKPLGPDVMEPTCLNRTIRVVPVKDVLEALPLLRDHQAHLQTVAAAGLGERRESLAEALATLGASRLTSFRQAPWPPPWWHHDGGSPLRALVRWTDLEGD